MKATRSKDLFTFKQFEVRQDRCAMKISTDAVVLGALASAVNAKSALEIGVGTGVVSLMLAQRFPELQITGVELDTEAYQQAVQNVAKSPWAKEINLVCGSIQDYAISSTKEFDLIVTNPPYYPDHLLASDERKNTAHHNLKLSFEDLLKSIQKLLTSSGNLWLILPPRQMAEFTILASQLGLYPAKEIQIADRPDKKPIRTVVNFYYNNSEFSRVNLYIKNSDGSYSEAYSKLLKDFLLIF